MAWQRQSGQVSVLTTLALVPLVACAALALDVGYFQNQRRKIQIAADSAAIAAEREILAGNPGSATAAAKNDSALNGFLDGANNVTVTVNNPPLSGPNAGDSNAAEVIVAQQQPTYLLRVIGINTAKVSARAVAIASTNPLCVYALNPTAEDAVLFFGVSLFRSNCGIIDNSDNGEALSFEIVSLVKAASFGVVGGTSSFLLSLVSPTPVTGISPMPDPFAQDAAPSVHGCDHTNYQVPLVGNATIDPGVYCGGITSPVGSVGSLTLTPGTYIINGGGLQLTGAAFIHNLTSGGDGNGGVTFYLTGDSTHYEGVNLTGVALNSLNAPTSGPYEGMLFFQDRSISPGTAASHPNTLIGADLAKYEGVLYFPTTKLIYSGANLAAYTIIVADQIHFDLANLTVLHSDYSSLYHGPPVKSAILGE